jgi:hypothetical protein
MAKKKPAIIPEVDIIKSGINREKPYEINSDGLVKISRKPKINKIIEKNTVSDLMAKEKELEDLKKKLEEIGVSKSDVKDIKDDIKKDKKKKKKKDKKKKKKDKEKGTYMNSLMDAVPDDLAAYIRDGGEKGAKKKKKKDKKKKKEREKIQGLTVKEKKKKDDKSTSKKKTLEKDKNNSEVAQRFKEVEKITRDNIKEIDSTLEVVTERINDIMKSGDRVRGRDRALADYIAAKTSLISSRQKAATDILSNRAKVYEIEMKKAKESSANASSDADLITKLFPGIALNSATVSAVNEHIGKSGKNKDSKKKKKDKKYKEFYDVHEDGFLKREKALLDSGDIEYSKYDENIEYEGAFDVAIKKSFQTGEWKFVAVDDNNRIIDVPKSMLPSKKTTSMKFDDEKDTALDVNSNRMYTVFSVPQI